MMSDMVNPKRSMFINRLNSRVRRLDAKRSPARRRLHCLRDANRIGSVRNCVVAAFLAMSRLIQIDEIGL